MAITIAQSAGFCFGVKRATDFVEKLVPASPQGAKIYTIGALIHNRLYNCSLEEKGVYAIDITQAENKATEANRTGVGCVFVIRTHGIPAEEERALYALEKKYPNVTVKDMTCPFVRKIHRIADTYTNENTCFLLLGTASHPEVLGIMSHVRGEKAVFGTAEEIREWLSVRQNDEKQLVFAAQTTQSIQEWKKSQKIIEKLYTNAIFFDTICSVTENRQTEAATLSAECDRMIVVGGKESSNTRKLYDLCRQNCQNTVWIESAGELTEDFISSATIKTGITAGASTPRGIILEVYNKMENFEEMLEESLKTLHTGETVDGIVTAIGTTEVYVDLGAKVTGVIAYDQITDESGVDLRSLFKVGDTVRAFVIRVDDGHGVATLSKKRVDNDRAWENFIALSESGEAIEGKVTEAVKGGVLMFISGTRVFIPASQTGFGKDADFSSLVGQTKKIRIIEIDKQKKRVIGSIRAIASEERKAAEEALMATIEVGQKFTGTVKNLTTYGAFVDIGGVDGMVHNSELSWKKIKHPSQVVSVGQQIEVYVKEVDKEKGRISLGYKTEEMDEFYQFAKAHEVGEVLEGKIVNMMPFGAFAEIAPGVDGLIHISQISLDKIANPAEVLTVGQTVTVKLTAIDKEERRISLSIRALLDEARRAEEKAAYEAEKAEKAAERKAAADEEAALRAEMAPYIVKSID